MSRTFLSYSRSDIEFVRRLQKALADANEETWVDWSGIPPTAEFAREIEKGIEASDNFVFVISPDSVAPTSYGLKEIAHAAQMGKRMVPILRRAVPNGAVPETLAKFNYIYFRETDDFEAAFALLTTALHSDLAWTGAQARLLVRALEWERQEKDDSFLLRGTDLNDAEAWQAQAATKSGKPTPLKSEYIAKSRTSATRRQRQLLGAVAAGLVTAIGLAIYAFFQARVARNETAIANDKTVEAKKQTYIANAQTKIAVEQTHRAEEQANLATSRNLAGESLLVKDTQPDLAALLSVESMHMADSYDSRNAIVGVWQAWPNLVRMLHATSSRKLISLLFSSNGSRFVTLDELNNLVLWEAKSLRPIWTEHLYYGASAALSRDGSLIAVQVYGRITIERTADRRILWKDLKGGTKDIRFFSFNPDGTLFAARSEEGIQVWSMADGLPLRDLSREQETATTYGQSGIFAFDPVDSKTLAITLGNRVVEFEDALSGKVAKAIPIETDQPVEKFRSGATDFLSRGLSFSSDGKRMAVNAGYQKVQVWKLDVRGTAGPGPRDRLEGEISVENHRTGTGVDLILDIDNQAARTALRSGRSISSIAGSHRSLKARDRSCTMC